ncbi:MAG: PqqD family protein [Acidimicrobiia bacterium]|nr:PqqD family protein [Acidimicrobiia bacterium]
MSYDWMNLKPRRHGQAWVRRGSDDTAVYNPETGTLHVLNPSALAIWELCDGETTGREMAEAVAELTTLDLDAAASDVVAALSQLVSKELCDV